MAIYKIGLTMDDDKYRADLKNVLKAGLDSGTNEAVDSILYHIESEGRYQIIVKLHKILSNGEPSIDQIIEITKLLNTELDKNKLVFEKSKAGIDSLLEDIK